MFSAAGIEPYHVLVSGDTGVKLFYVISGFLITTLVIREHRETGIFSFKGFFIRRSLRIFPLYYLALACYLTVTFIGAQKVTPVSFAYAASYLYNFIPRADYQSWLGSFHTLATEEHFYLAFPWLFLLLFRGRGLMFAAFALAYMALVPGLRPMFADYEQTHVVERWALLACVPILVGCFAAWLRESGAFRAPLVPGSVALTALRIAAPLVVVATLVSQPFAYRPMLPACAFALLLVYLAEAQSSLLCRLLALPPLACLGKIAYGLCVWQPFICATGAGERLISPIPLALLTVLILSVLSYELFEKRLLQLKVRRPSTLTSTAAPALQNA